jgi:hypothetical protein
VPAIGAGNPDPKDLDAVEQLDRNEAGRLDLVRTRAEKWIGGVAALTGILGTALVIKGPADVSKIDQGYRIAVAAAIAFAIGLLALATYRAYSAAFGEPGSLQQISADPVAGLHARLTEARKQAATEALSDLKSAVRYVFIAVALIAIAVGITWFAPTESSSSATTCIYANGTLVTSVSGSSVTIKSSAAGTEIKPCP